MARTVVSGPPDQRNFFITFTVDEGIRYEFVAGGEIVPYLAPHESRRLFGGAEGPVHSHTHERYLAIDAETGRAYGRPPVRAHPHTDADPQGE